MATNQESAQGGSPPGGSQLLSSPASRVVAALVGATVLAAGYLLRPDRPVTAAAEEAPTPLLRQVVEQRQAQTTFRALQQTATNSLGFVARLSLPAREPEFWSDWQPAPAETAPAERYGVAIDPSQVLAEGSAMSAGDEVSLVFGDGRTMTGVVTTRVAGGALALISPATSTPLPAPPIAATVQPGDAVVGVAPGAQGPVVAPLFVASSGADGILTTTPLDAFRGMAVFNDTGALVGIVGVIAGRTRIVRMDAATAAHGDPIADRPTLGISLTLTRGDRTHAPPTVVIAGVAPDSPAAAAGLQPGDVLLIQGQPAASIGSAASALESAVGTDGRLQVSRGERILTLRLDRSGTGQAQ